MELFAVYTVWMATPLDMRIVDQLADVDALERFQCSLGFPGTGVDVALLGIKQVISLTSHERPPAK